MTKQPINQKCRFCGADTIGSDVCHKCLDNPERQKFFEVVEEAKLGTLEPKTYQPYSYFCDDPEEETGFKPARVAIYINEEEHFKTDRKTGIVYFGDESKGTWSQDGETKIAEIIGKILGENNRAVHYTNILHHLKAITYTDIHFSEKVAVENGLLNLETLELTPFSLSEMAFYQIATTYNPAADCPQWQAFLEDILPDEKDRLLLQEWSGFLLLPDYRFHKILWCHGSGRNGKSVWNTTMQRIIGEQNCSEVPLTDFNGFHRFAMARLYGKLLNTCSEPAINKKYVLQTSLLKATTGQDIIEAEIKNKQQTLKFRNCSKITILANRFPKVEDNTIAFKERRLFITFPNEFIGKNCIVNIERNWLDDPIERMGILNWMLQGLQRLLANGCFTESKSQLETEILFQRASDPIGAFITEIVKITKNKDDYKGRKEAWEYFKNYCEIYGLECGTEKTLTQRLKDTKGISEGKRFVQSLGKRDRAWIGLDFKPLPEPKDEEENGVSGTDGTAKEGVNNTELLAFTQKNKESKERVPSVPSVPSVNQKVCGNCANFHEPSLCAATRDAETRDKDALPFTNWCFREETYEELEE